MGKPTDRKKKSSNKTVLDQEMSLFIDMSVQLKEEGDKLLQKLDFQGAILKYDKAIKLLPKTHKDIPLLHANIASCYVQMKPAEYYRAINACNLALEVSPNYAEALVKRARCFEAINRADLAFKDAELALNLEPNNVYALEIYEREKKFMELNGIKFAEKEIPSEIIVPKEKSRKKKRDKSEKSANKLFVKEEEKITEEEETPKAIKFVYGDDIRNAQIPSNCTILQLREIARSKFPGLNALLVKYKDSEGDLVTITASDELNWAINSSETIKLFVTEAKSDQELSSEGEGYNGNYSINGSEKEKNLRNNSENEEREDWTLQFARLLKNHAGLDSDSCLYSQDLGIRLNSEAMEETLNCKEAQEIFSLSEKKFEETACLAFFNWGNIHMSRARKMLHLPENLNNNNPKEKNEILETVKNAFEYSRNEYTKAEEKYKETLRVNPEFYEGHLALSQQYFEQAKLHWYYSLGSKTDFSEKILHLFNQSEESMEKGTEIWSTSLKKVNNAELAGNFGSQIEIFLGTLLYERSVVEFKLGFMSWEECLMESVERFKNAGAGPTDVAVMVKNHPAHETAQDGFGFKIDEIIQAWNDMYDAKRWKSGVPSFIVEPLFRRRAPKLHSVLEHIQYV
ncbi:hypothetical protein LUZ60_006285 [Juncus effusus]|nr:hypothetical protein LUZ60_006285 [Juncus effusus]